MAKGAGCCGALTHHMGREKEAHGSAEANIHAWMAEIEGEGLDAIVINTSGCGTTVKDYGHMFRTSPLAEAAAQVSAKAMDISELLRDLEMPEGAPKGLRVAYHAACSLQHGQKAPIERKQAVLQAIGDELIARCDELGTLLSREEGLSDVAGNHSC